MKRTIFILITASALALMLACGCRGGRGKAAENAAPVKFELPVVPAIYQSDQERAEYIAQHYWDKFDFSDTTLISNADVTEQGFTDFVYLAGHLSPEVGTKAVSRMLDGAAVNSDMYTHFADVLADKYLYDPNSPMRNEDLYIAVLRHMIASDKLSDLEKIRPRERLEMALKNRVGDKAADFTLRLAGGRTMRLYDVRAKYTLVFFNNPDCHTCAELIGQLSESAIVAPPSGALKVVMAYPDEDIKAWEDHRKDIPAAWINGYDASQTLRSRKLYDLKAIPALYLLDSDKNVIIKDAASVVPLEYYFGQN